MRQISVAAEFVVPRPQERHIIHGWSVVPGSSLDR